MKTLLNILKYTESQRERMIFETWFGYADIITHSDQDLQKVLANTAYFNWFLSEYIRLENQFLEDIQQYLGKIDLSAIRDFYNETTCQIGKYHSKHLLRKARKLNIINHPQIN